MTTEKLSSRHCAPCNGQMPKLLPERIALLGEQLHEHWQISKGSTTIERRFVVKGFAKAAYIANLCAWLADREGHHPDITFGWGYCSVLLTTHDVGGLTENDFIWAAQLDVLMA